MPSDYERQTKKRQNQEQSRKKAKMTETQRLAEEMGLTEEQFIALQEGRQEEIPVMRPAYQYKCGKPLLETPEEVSRLPTSMRELHSWYMSTSNGEGKNSMFEVRVPQEIYRTDVEEQMWVEFDCLFNLF